MLSSQFIYFTSKSFKLISKCPFSIHTNNSNKFKVLFAGTGHFESAFIYTKECIEELGYNDKILITSCHQNDVLHELNNTSILVPLMSKIGVNEFEVAKKLSNIIQFGVGLEGIYIHLMIVI